MSPRLDWYQVLARVRAARPAIDLSTGEPLHHEGIAAIVRAELARLASSEQLPSRLASYDELDGTPELLSVCREGLTTTLGRPVTDDELLVVPGVQAALRYVQAAMRDGARAIHYPVGLEFPGAVDPGGARTWGAPAWAADGTIADLPPPAIPPDIGAVVLSRPHSPTGRVWPSDDVTRLATAARVASAWLVLDETYALPWLPLQDAPVDLADGPNIVHLFSFSKVGLAAERVGVVFAAPAVISVLRAELRRQAITASHVGQLLAARILVHAAELQATVSGAYRDRWCEAVTELAPLRSSGIAVARWEGGPFLWLHWAGGPESSELFSALLEQGVAVAPGDALHAGHERVNGLRIGLGATVDIVAAGARCVAAELRTRFS